MNEINRQISQAQRRLILTRFFRFFSWVLFVCLAIASIGVALPKIWALDLVSESLRDNWNLLWIGSSIGLALLIAATIAWATRESRLQVAVEVDSRYGLKERLSSALVLDQSTRESAAGQALLQDAVRQAETLDIRDRFGVHFNRSLVWLLLPIAMLLILLYVPDAVATTPAAGAASSIDKKEIKSVVESVRKKLKKRETAIANNDLKEALKNLNIVDRQIDKISDANDDEKKDALVKLNDIKKKVADRQSELGGAKQLKERLKKLSDVGNGPAKQIADAMKAGDFKAAKDAIQQLAEKLKKGQLSETEKKQLANDLKKLAEQFKDMARKHEQAKRELEEKIKQAQQQGDLEQAARMQQKLDELKKRDQQQQQMQKMADKLQKCADCMGQNNQSGGNKQGDNQPQGQPGGNQMKQAGQALEDLAQQMEDLQQEFEELQDLEDLQKDLDQIKQNVQGQPGDGDMGAEPQWGDWAQGKGLGGGKRASEENETGGYKSKVGGKLQRGQQVVSGSANGANAMGQSTREARVAVKTSMSSEIDPLENQKLPRSQREHAQQYFEKMRKGN